MTKLPSWISEFRKLYDDNNNSPSDVVYHYLQYCKEQEGKIKEEFDVVKEATEELYNLNRTISLHFIGLKKEVDEQDIFAINKQLGEIIRKLRSVQEKGVES